MSDRRKVWSLSGVLSRFGFTYRKDSEIERKDESRVLFWVMANSRKNWGDKLYDNGVQYGILDWQDRESGEKLSSKKLTAEEHHLVKALMGAIYKMVEHDVNCGCEGCAWSLDTYGKIYLDALKCLVQGDGGTKIREISKPALYGFNI